MRPHAVIRALPILAVALAGSANAQPVDVRARADAFNDQGKQRYREGDLAGAANRFRQATALSPEPRFYFNLCFVQEKRGELRSALIACEAALEGEVSERLAGKTRSLIEQIRARLHDPDAKPAQGEQDAAPKDAIEARPTVRPVGARRTRQPRSPAFTEGQPAERRTPPPLVTYGADAGDTWEERQWSVSGHLGIGTPFGIVGAEAERAFSPAFAVAAGFGRGVGGAQLGAEARLRYTGTHTLTGYGWALGFSGGFSGGDAHLVIPTDKELDNAVWLNLGGYYESRFAGWFMFRFYGGWSELMTSDSCVEDDFFDGPQDCDTSGGGAPFFGTAIGVAL